MKKSMGIFTKIYLVAFLCMLVPLIVSTWILTAVASRCLAANAENNLQDMAEEKVTALENYIATQKVITRSVASNPVVLDALCAYQDTGKIDMEDKSGLGEYLALIRSETGGLYENFFITAGSEGIADCMNNTTLHDVEGENFYQQCQQNGFYFGNNVSPVTGKPVYVIAYAIKDPQSGVMLGAVNNSIDLATLASDVVNDDRYEVNLFDLSGILIASRDAASILKVDMNEMQPQMWADLVLTTAGYFEYDDPTTNEKRYTGFASSSNFLCELAISASVFDKDSEALVRAALGVGCVCFLVAAVFIFFCAGSIARPIRQANKEVQKLISDINGGHGDLATKIAIKTGDETGQLVSSLNQFIATLDVIIGSAVNTAGNIQKKLQ